MTSDPPSPSDDQRPPTIPTARPAGVAPEPAPLPSTDNVLVPMAAKVQHLPMKMSPIRAVVELIVVALVAVLTEIGAVLFISGRSLSDERWVSIADALGLGLGATLAALVMLRLAGHRLLTLGWTTRDFAANVGFGMLALLGTYIVLFQASIIIITLWPEMLTERSVAQEAIEQTFPRMSFGLVVLLCLFVAFWEELVFRGFVLTRMHAIFRRWWLAVPIAATAFGMLHVYEGWLAVGAITFLGLVMGTLFVWRKSLVPSMAYHLVHNVLIFQLLGAMSSTWE